MKTSKAQTQDAMPQTSENGKKEATSERAAAHTAIPAAPAPAKSLSAESSTATVGLSVKGDAIAQEVGPKLIPAETATGSDSVPSAVQQYVASKVTGFLSAAAATGNTSNNEPQIKTSTTQNRDSKPQPTDSRKKEAASEPVAANPVVPATPAPLDLASAEASKLTIGLPVKDDASQTLSQRVKPAASAPGIESGAGADQGYIAGKGNDLQSSFTASGNGNTISSDPQVTSTTQTQDAEPQTSTNRNAAATSAVPAASRGGATAIEAAVGTGNLNAASLLPTGAALPVGAGSQENVPSVKSNPDGRAITQSGLSQTVAVQGTQVAAPVPVSEAGTTKAAHIEGGTNTSKAADPSNSTSDRSNSSADASTIDPSVLAAQQGAAAIMQRVADPNSLANFSSAGDFQSVSPVATGKTATVNPAADTSKGTASPVKGKVATSDVLSKRSDDASSDTQSSNTTAVTAAAAAPVKVQDTPVSVNHSVSSSNGGSDGAGLPQATPAGQLAGSNHGPETAQSASGSADTTAQSAPAASDPQAMQGVNSAQLIQSMHSSEMKLGIQSAEFGNISISTSLNHQALSAQISIDHSDLGRALAVHLPAIEEKLGSAYGVQAKVELRDSNNPSSSNDSGGYSSSGQQSREQRQSQGGGSAAAQSAMFERIAAHASLTTTAPIATASRLDIRI